MRIYPVTSSDFGCVYYHRENDYKDDKAVELRNSTRKGIYSIDDFVSISEEEYDNVSNGSGSVERLLIKYDVI